MLSGFFLMTMRFFLSRLLPFGLVFRRLPASTWDGKVIFRLQVKRIGIRHGASQDGALQGDDLPSRSLGRLKDDGAALIDLGSGMSVKSHGTTDDFVARGFVFTRKGIQIALQVFADPDFQARHGFSADGSGDGGGGQPRMRWADTGSLPGTHRKMAGSIGELWQAAIQPLPGREAVRVRTGAAAGAQGQATQPQCSFQTSLLAMNRLAPSPAQAGHGTLGQSTPPGALGGKLEECRNPANCSHFCSHLTDLEPKSPVVTWLLPSMTCRLLSGRSMVRVHQGAFPESKW